MRFHDGMPRKRHRRYLRSFDNCFTGEEAVEFLMNELPKLLSEKKDITRFAFVNTEIINEENDSKKSKKNFWQKMHFITIKIHEANEKQMQMKNYKNVQEG